MSEWTPLGEVTRAADEFHPGVPAWLDVPLNSWILDQFEFSVDNVTGPRISRPMLYALDAAFRLEDTLGRAHLSSGTAGAVARLLELDKLKVADWLLSEARKSSVGSTLEAILWQARSAWKVGTRDGRAGLVDRMPKGIALSVDSTIRGAGDAGSLLAEAWNALHRMEPNYEEAYEQAIKSVEEISIPVVSPANKIATLGSVVRDMEKQGSWELNLPSMHASVVLPMMQALWTGQESRHGANDYRKPTREEAVSAVALAVAIVQFFHERVVRRTGS